MPTVPYTVVLCPVPAMRRGVAEMLQSCGGAMEMADAGGLARIRCNGVFLGFQSPLLGDFRHGLIDLPYPHRVVQDMGIRLDSWLLTVQT